MEQAFTVETPDLAIVEQFLDFVKNHPWSKNDTELIADLEVFYEEFKRSQT